REIDIALQRHRALHLKKWRAGERAQQDLPSLRAEPVPGVTANSFQLDIRDDRTHAERLAGKIDTQHVPDEAAAAIGANQIAGAQDFVSDLRGDAFGILREAGQLPTK